MKLICCTKCGDIVTLKVGIDRKCLCGLSGGSYLSVEKAEIWGEAIPLGFSNTSFIKALRTHIKTGEGIDFKAFVISKECFSVSKK